MRWCHGVPNQMIHTVTLVVFQKYYVLQLSYHYNTCTLCYSCQ